eukprot:687216-Prymnesium_polylepis.1
MKSLRSPSQRRCAVLMNLSASGISCSLRVLLARAAPAARDERAARESLHELQKFLPSAISHQSSAISHQPSVISH